MLKNPVFFGARFPHLLKAPNLLAPYLIIFASITFIPGCTRAQVQTSFSRRIYPASGTEEIHIDLEDAELNLLGSPAQEIILEGWSTDPDFGIVINEAEGIIQIQVHQTDTAHRVHLELMVPDGSTLMITQAKGVAQLRNFDGKLTLRGESADISADHISGVVILATRRGSIHVSLSEGEIHALAEADDIHLTDLHGQVSATNIIGGITFSGRIGEGDALRFETDHGDVVVNLSTGSSAGIQLTSAGGRIVCSLPGLSGMFDRCSGLLGDAAGTLTIRTVSGAIILNTTP